MLAFAITMAVVFSAYLALSEIGWALAKRREINDFAAFCRSFERVAEDPEGVAAEESGARPATTPRLHEASS
jgi:hypothetical protein